ncbi:MAG: hypothetical protein ACRC55_02745 [Plesiomonas sp.]
MMSSDPYCIPCEKYDRWIELDIRDENNHAFSGQKAILTDSTGMEIYRALRRDLIGNQET